MNYLTVSQTSQGLAQYLTSSNPWQRRKIIFIGYDHRRSSDSFARVAEQAFIRRQDFRVFALPDFSPTPVISFAIRYYYASAGSMLTAGHRPGDVSGYKIYDANGCQIVQPADLRIEQRIKENLQVLHRWHSGVPSLNAPSTVIPPNVDPDSWASAAYTHETKLYLDWYSSIRQLRFTYTPMHGISLRLLNRVILESSGFVIVGVQGQSVPDVTFPILPNPSPEENGALRLAQNEADQLGHKLVLANGPDGGCFTAAEKVDGSWKRFTGDQVGVLLAQFLLDHFKRTLTKDDYMLTTAVSSIMLHHMADREGLSVEVTPVECQWLGNQSLKLSQAGKRVHFAYEETMGYMFPEISLDKDGIVAAVMFIKACGQWNGSPWAKLQKLYRKHGYFKPLKISWHYSDVGPRKSVFLRLTAFYPRVIGLATGPGGRRVVRWRYLYGDPNVAYDSGEIDRIPPPLLPTGTEMVECWLGPSKRSREAIFKVRSCDPESITHRKSSLCLSWT